MLRDSLLLWSTDGKQTEEKRTVGLDETQTALESNGVVNETHRWIEVRQVAQAIALAQPLGLLVAAADQNQGVIGADDAAEEPFRQVAAGTNRKPDSPGEAQHFREKSAVEQYVTGRRVQCAKRGVLVQADDVIRIGGHS